MEHKYEVRFAKSDPETPPTMEEQIALARVAARKLGVPNAESAPRYRVGKNSHSGDGYRGILVLGDRGSGKSIAVTLWESEAAMRESEEAANKLRGEASEAGGEEIVSVERFEVLIDERDS